ncbi:hypothetical protein Q5752_002721 [Cryptotrichosporon argae]
MGISGLLPLLKDIQVSGNIQDFKGKRLAVDGYVWLHKGAFGCAEDLVKGKRTTKFVDYAMHRVRMLRHWGVTPVMVFDGGPLPAKRKTEDSRAKSRAEHLARAQSFEAQRRMGAARDCYTKCLDITPELAFQLIKALRAEKVEYIVAPYEADAQLCYLEREGYVDGIITEDSDLLVFGCKQVIFKLEKDGSCVSIDRKKLASIRDFPMHGWTDTQFRRMAMLSGCDYLPSIPGIGLKTAHRMLRRHKTVDKMLKVIRLEGAHVVPIDYLQDFAQAELAFIHQRVFEPTERRLVPLRPFPEGGLGDTDERWVGLDVDAEVAQGMARGDLHPATRKPIEDLWPDYQPLPFGQKDFSGKAVLPRSPAKGTLDSFFIRVKRTASAPVPLPTPVGRFGSGPKRLSDLPAGPARRASDPESSTPPVAGPSSGRTSKFFLRAEPIKLEWAEDAEAVVGIDADDIESQSPVYPRMRSTSPVHVHSPSPELEATQVKRSPSPAVSVIHLSSPVSVAPSVVFTTPPRSSPLRDASPFRPSSPSPSRRHVLVEASSQFVCETQLFEAQSSRPVPTITQVPFTAFQASQDASTPARTCALGRKPSVLVPATSPAQTQVQALDLRRALRIGTSSDSIDDDEILTPSPHAASRHKRARGSSSSQPAEVDSEDEARARKATIVAHGWRAKYALGAAASPVRTPRVKPRPRAGERDPPAAPRDEAKGHMPQSLAAGLPGIQNTPVPLSRLAAGVLAPRPVNIEAPTSARANTAADATVKDAAAAIKSAPPKPHGLTWASLEKFRYSRP